MSALGAVSGALVKVYQKHISRDYNADNHAHCMYTPSCSHYMQDAVAQEGVFAGTLDGLMRLQRCKPDVLAVYMQRFVGAVAACPADQLASTFPCETPEALDKLKALKDVTTQLQQGQTAAQAQLIALLQNDLGFRVVDTPGHHNSGFEVYSKADHDHAHGAPVRPNVVARAAGYAGAVAGGAVGGILGGLTYGIIGGTVFAPAAALGRTDKLNARITEKYGPETVVGLAGLERKFGIRAYRTRAWVIDHTHLNWLGSAAGLIVGVPAGIAAGVWHGMTEFGKAGSHAGGVLFRNLLTPLAPPVQPEPSAPVQWTVIGKLDATARDLEPATTRELINFQEMKYPGVRMVAELTRDAHGPTRERMLGFAQKWLVPAAAVGAAVACTVTGLSPLFAIDAVATGAFVHWRGRKRLGQVEKQVGYHHEPGWSGTRRYDVSATAPGDTGSIRAPELPGAGQGLADLIEQARAVYPSQRNLLLISGHGHDYRRVAGMKPAEVGDALKAAYDKSGRKMDLVVVEACKGGNLEALRKWAPYANYAVVSEDVIWDAGFPWKKVLDETNGQDVDARKLGETIVHWSGGVELNGDPKVPTAALIDLSKLEPLAQAVEGLGSALQAVPDKEAVRNVMREALHFPRADKPTWHGLLGKLQQCYLTVKQNLLFPDLADIGGIAANASSLAPQQASAVQTALADAVVANQVHPTYAGKANGLSVRVLSPIFFERHYREQTDMPTWGHLVNSARPWNARLGSNALEAFQSILTWPFRH